MAAAEPVRRGDCPVAIAPRPGARSQQRMRKSRFRMPRCMRMRGASWVLRMPESHPCTPENTCCVLAAVVCSLRVQAAGRTAYPGVGEPESAWPLWMRGAFLAACGRPIAPCGCRSATQLLERRRCCFAITWLTSFTSWNGPGF